MNRFPNNNGLPAGIRKLSEIDLAEEAGKNTAIARILQTREVRQTLADLLPDVLNLLAGDKRVKKVLFRLVGRYLNKSLSRPDDVFEKPELLQLFEDDAFVRNIAEPLPDIINGLFNVIDTAATTIEKLDTGEKKELFGELIEKLATGQTGTLITRGCRIINDIHKDDPEFFARRLEPGFRKWIETVDFGELREMIDRSGNDARAMVVMINEVIWQYPAKVVLLLSLIPSLVNMVTTAADISLEKLNELPPDLLTDVILSFLDEIRAEPVAGVINALTELVRKIHTGSGLLGEPGAPQLPKLLAAKIDTIITAVDPVTLWKAKTALAETGAAFELAMAAAVNRMPAFKQLAMIKGPEIANIHMKTANQKLAHWDSIDDEETAKSMANHFSAYDVQELGEMINNTLRLFNRVAGQRPELLPGLVGQAASAIDEYELAEAARHIFNGAGDRLQPVARAFVPGLVKWISASLKPADDDYENDAEDARAALRSIFEIEEV